VRIKELTVGVVEMFDDLKVLFRVKSGLLLLHQGDWIIHYYSRTSSVSVITMSRSRSIVAIAMDQHPVPQLMQVIHAISISFLLAWSLRLLLFVKGANVLEIGIKRSFTSLISLHDSPEVASSSVVTLLTTVKA
jgi:hypothetical protein